jgi:hypothetical protein
LTSAWRDTTRHDALFDAGWGEVVPGSITALGCVLRGYVYHVFEDAGHTIDLGWYPFCPNPSLCPGPPPGPAPPRWDYTYVLDGTAGRFAAPGPTAGSEGKRRWSRAYVAFDGDGVEIRVVLPRSQHIAIEIFDVSGRRVASLSEHGTAPGVARVRWDGRDPAGNALPDGVYFYRLRAGSHEEVARLLLVRR